MIIDIFLPCRASSQRVKNKNIKKFSSIKNGLLEIKINQLKKIKKIRNIIISTNDKKIIKYINGLKIKNIILDKRSDELSSNNTKTDDLIKYVPKITDAEHILWTHVTSPFFDTLDYANAIDVYNNNLKNFDSLMGVVKLQEFIYDKKNPINFNKSIEKWPQTQKLKELYFVNSCIFLSSIKNYIKYKDRIGNKPFFYISDRIKSFDIDWPDDFKLAENIYNTFF